jgi:hypothetical protein
MIITDVGLNAANNATPEGPFVHLVGFKIGSAFGYTPTTSQTGLQGNELFSAQVTSYQNIGNNTVDFLCIIPPEAGPFEFGEVAIYMADANGQFSDDSALFAIAVFDTPQTKFSSLGTNVISSYTLHCLLKLQQSTAIFQVDTVVPVAVLDVFQWSDVFPPGVSANPDIPILNVRELTPANDSSLLSNASDSFWTVSSGYYVVRNAAVVANSSTTWVEFPAATFHTNDLTAANRTWLLETADGFFRSVNNFQVSGANYRLNLNTSNDGVYNNTPLLTAPPVGSHCRLYSYNQTGNLIHYDQIIDPPSIPLATNGVAGLVRPGSGLSIATAGVIDSFGMNHTPGLNTIPAGNVSTTGRSLTTGETLTSVSYASGVYYCDASQSIGDIPVAGNTWYVWISNYGITNRSPAPGQMAVTQLAFPQGPAGGDGVGNNGLPPYWRTFLPGVGWTAWSALKSNNKQFGGGGVTGKIQSIATTKGNDIFSIGLTRPTGPGVVFVTLSDDGNSGDSQQLIVNNPAPGPSGSVATARKNGGGGFGRSPFLSGPFLPGCSISIGASSNPTGTFFVIEFDGGS